MWIWYLVINLLKKNEKRTKEIINPINALSESKEVIGVEKFKKSGALNPNRLILIPLMISLLEKNRPPNSEEVTMMTSWPSCLKV
jgi:hypothetical protein